MYPGIFDYEAPETEQEALALLAVKTEAKILAGGQTLLPAMKQRFMTPKLLIDIARVRELIHLRDEGETVLVGARLTHAHAAIHGALLTEVPLLAKAASWVADRQVRRMGTICGSLVAADPTSDECCATLCLGATMLVHSITGMREIPADQFFVDGHQSALEPHEMLVAIRYPKLKRGEGWGYDKLGVRGGHSGWAVTGAAVWIKMAAGEINAARIAISGAGRVTTLAQKAAYSLIGTNGSLEDLKKAARIAVDEVDSLADLSGSIAYKQQLIQVYVRRALIQAMTNVDRY